MGAKVGANEGSLIGVVVGSGVGVPDTNVGADVGLVVGALVGEALGFGVGTPSR